MLKLATIKLYVKLYKLSKVICFLKKDMFFKVPKLPQTWPGVSPTTVCSPPFQSMGKVLQWQKNDHSGWLESSSLVAKARDHNCI